jgi:hypothetical protein
VDWSLKGGRIARSTVAYVFEYRIVLLALPRKVEHSRAGGSMLIDRLAGFLRDIMIASQLARSSRSNEASRSLWDWLVG